jgi:hypothetical protein
VKSIPVTIIEHGEGVRLYGSTGWIAGGIALVKSGIILYGPVGYVPDGYKLSMRDAITIARSSLEKNRILDREESMAAILADRING